MSTAIMSVAFGPSLTRVAPIAVPPHTSKWMGRLKVKPGSRTAAEISNAFSLEPREKAPAEPAGCSGADFSALHKIPEIQADPVPMRDRTRFRICRTHLSGAAACPERGGAGAKL